MLFYRGAFFALVIVAFLAACGGNGSVPGGSLRGVPTAGPISGPTLSPTVVATAMAKVESYYQTLPHTNPVADVNAVAQHMVSSGAFKTAKVTPGGITATLPDGRLALVFADSIEDIDPKLVSRSASRHVAVPQARPMLQSAPHGISFLVNQLDTRAFPPAGFAPLPQAFQGLGFTAAAGYGVDEEDVDLSQIAMLSHAHPLDMLVIATHGMVVIPTASAKPELALQSTNRITDPSIATFFAPDLAAGNLVASVYLTIEHQSGAPASGLYSFTPGFLAAHLAFNPGAFVFVNACYSSNTQALANTLTTLQTAPGGIGRYAGWTKSVANGDAIESFAFLLDRTLGEQSPSLTGLDALVTQRTPPQRPFHLDDVETAMNSELRDNPKIQAPQKRTYTVSNDGFPNNAIVAPIGDTAAYLTFSDTGAEKMANPPIVYLMPSITTMSVAESAAGGTLTINGDFPYAPGGVLITDNSGPHLLTPSNWTAHQITVPIPDSGDGSAGNVQVLAVDANPAIGGNLAPLTQWSGTVTYSEHDDISSMGGVSGTGNGSLTAQFDITFRSDVHPTVPSIDTSPVPQNLYFENVEGNSTAAVTQLAGNFASSEGTPPPPTAALSLSSIATLTPHALPISRGTFIVGAFRGQPAPCNNASPGPEGDQGNVFCPAFGYFPPRVGFCSDDPSDSGLCGGPAAFSPTGSFGAPSLLDPGLVMFTMDPASYAISVTASNTSFTRTFRGNPWPASASVSGTITAPSYAPTTSTPAARRRVPLRVHGAKPSAANRLR